jgi:hypothetical protein
MASDLNPQNQRARVTIFRNGAPADAGKLLTFDFIHATWADLLETARVKLGADKPFTRVFVQNGAEAESLGDIFPGDDLYFSHGEPFVVPAGSAASPSTSAASPAAVVTLPAPPASPADQTQFVTNAAQSVAKTAEKLYSDSAQFVKERGPTIVKVTLEKVEDSVGAVKPQLMQKLLQMTHWADEKVDGAYQSLQKRKADFLASPVGQTANQYFNASALGLQTFVVEPAQAFMEVATQKFHQLQAASQDGKVAVEAFVAGLKEQLGAAWNEKLVEPAKAVHEAISKEVAARLQHVSENKSVQQLNESAAHLAAQSTEQLAAVQAKLGRAWEEVVVANFQTRVMVPAESFYQLALANFMQLRASGKGRVTFNEFVAGLRAATGRLWNDHLLPPARHLYQNFTLAAAHLKDAVGHSREVDAREVEMREQPQGGKGAAGSQ